MIFRIEERLPTYKEIFDIVIINDWNMKLAVDIIKYIVEETNYPCMDETEEYEDCIVVPACIG